MTQPSHHRSVTTIISLALLLGGASACGSGPSLINYRIAVTVPPDINSNSPVPVSFVTATSVDFLKRVEQLSAEKWFAQREQFHRDDPSGLQFTEWYWEFVPGHSPQIQQIEVSDRNVGMIVFANYRSPGDHRVRVPPIRMIQIVMGEEDLTVQQLLAGADP